MNELPPSTTLMVAKTFLSLVVTGGLKVGDVFESSYSGRIGCMCGCKGKHTHTERPEEARDNYCSYSDRGVKSCARNAMKLLDECDYQELSLTDDYIYIEHLTRDRCYTLYFKPGLAASLVQGAESL